ncbi:radical SAM protein [Comamonas thiooxydans]|uniref:radical SAM protein n=1 Tax=Comamonas thiooxydans TaxID=363952 RepID=UPI000B411D12|nr:radical SAM protein [Comamonas thiooxydans]
MQLLHAYQNGGTAVSIFTDGTKIRETQSDAPPVWPEQMDLKITDYCDAGCAWCHEESTPRGLHADLIATLRMLEGLPAGVEIAIGGGDPLSHPGFAEFAQELRNRGLVPSVTVNGRHLARSRAALEKLIGDRCLFGVGVSFHEDLPDWDYENMVLHLIAGVNDPALLKGATKAHKILLLGYKQFGRGRKLFELRPEPVQKTLGAWYRLLPLVAREHHLSFDNLAITQLRPDRLFRCRADYDRQYMGNEGHHSMYVDAVDQEFALCSYSDQRWTWHQIGPMFQQVRASQGLATV